jgi:hypothetical protein
VKSGVADVKKRSEVTQRRVVKVDKSQTEKHTKRPKSALPTAVVEPVTILPHGRMWRMATGSSVVYVTDPTLACTLLGATRHNLNRLAMAIYTDRKGRTFAWQIRIATTQWQTVAKSLE